METNTQTQYPFLKDLDQDIYTKLESLSKKVMSKPLDKLTSTEFSDLVAMDLSILPTEMSISATATRPTSVKFATNSYFVAVKIDLVSIIGMISKVIDDSASMPTPDRIKRVIELKSMLYKVINNKYESHEQYLRALVRSAEAADGIEPIGRFANQEV